MDILGYLLVFTLIGLALRFAYRRFMRKRKPTPVKALLEDCSGDQELAERLIFAEMQRDESLGIQAAARAARARLKRDRVS